MSFFGDFLKEWALDYNTEPIVDTVAGADPGLSGLTGALSGASSSASGVTATGGTSSVDLPSIQDFVSQLTSALESEFASSASQIQAQKDLIDHSNFFTAEQNRLNRLFQQSSADKAMEFSAAEAQKNRDYQTHMSNTAYQRAVADLQAAGLNPILAVTQGGASSPAGTAGSAFQASGSAGSSASGTASKANAAGAWDADQRLLLTVINSAAQLLGDVVGVFRRGSTTSFSGSQYIFK